VRVTLYRLEFPMGFHIAPHELSLDETLPTIPADTLFSALVAAWERRGGDPALWLSPFLEGNPPFLLSSAFPRTPKELLFPKPLRFQPTLEWKEVEFLPKEDFFLAAGGKIPKSVPTITKTWEVEQIPRVTLDRVTLRSNLFYLARVRFQPGSGLWFAVAWRNPALPCGSLTFAQALDLALEELSLAGIGGDRSVGYGRFVVSRGDEEDWPEPKPQGFGVLLSRLWPRAEDWENLSRSLAWRFVEVGGFSYTSGQHVRRKRVRLVVEGSVVPAEVRGGLADLTPSDFHLHRIWRYGLAFLFGWEVEDGH
jgi:CRISPR-associated protein Csm4